MEPHQNEPIYTFAWRKIKYFSPHIGLIIFVLIIILYRVNSHKEIGLLKKNGKPTIATVISKMYFKSSSPSIKTEYYVDGKRYEGADAPDNRNIVVGDTFTIIYYPIDPNVERAKSNLEQ